LHDDRLFELDRCAARLSRDRGGRGSGLGGGSLPLYTLWRTDTTHDQLFAVIHCTLGDILIALTCLVIALILAGHRAWPVQHFAQVAILTLFFGLG
jgi:hypothetical protein